MKFTYLEQEFEPGPKHSTQHLHTTLKAVITIYARNSIL